jgi:hypothetical protein
MLSYWGIHGNLIKCDLQWMEECLLVYVGWEEGEFVGIEFSAS